MSELIHNAVEFATAMHSGQDRKYIDLPYITHPLAVMEIVRGVTDDPEVLAAAVLHDVLEDCECNHKQLDSRFGTRVADLVQWLTDDEKGNRETRKRLSCERLSRAPVEAKNIKLADLIHNTRSIVDHDPDFAKLYLREKDALLKVLENGDQNLWDRAYSSMARGWEKLGMSGHNGK